MFGLSAEQQPKKDQLAQARIAHEREAFALTLEPDVNALLMLCFKDRRKPEES